VLHEFITANRDEIIERCRLKVAGRPAPPPTQAEIDHGVPMFLDQLVDELRQGPTSNQAITATAVEHGRQFLRQGYSIAQLVHDYGDVCQTVTEMAIKQDARISADDFRALNRCLDDAIAGSVTEYSNQQQVDSEIGAISDSERLSVLARAVRVDLEAVKLAFDTMAVGVVGLTGGTAMLLQQSLAKAQESNQRMLAQLRVADPLAESPQ
jgi:hypothetical protein